MGHTETGLCSRSCTTLSIPWKCPPKWLHNHPSTCCPRKRINGVPVKGQTWQATRTLQWRSLQFVTFQSNIVSNDFVIKRNLAFRAITPTNFPSSEVTKLLHNFNLYQYPFASINIFFNQKSIIDVFISL